MTTIKLKQDGFINRSKGIYGDRFDYSLVNYKNNKTNVILICKFHGKFETRPDNHLNNNKIGCPKCVKNKKLTIQEFIDKANKIHNNKYDYSLVDYKNNKTKVKIICTIHGEFEQLSSSHLKGNGCYKCAKNKSISTQEFIKKSNEIHTNKYDYSLVDYKNIKTKVKIICPIHGEFEQISGYHLDGCGCVFCGGNLKLTNQDFIEKASIVHNNKYNYSLVDYKNNKTKVKIVCPIHGEFLQNPDNHLYGRGCIKCAHDSKKLNLYDFINKSNIIHNNKYDYSLTEYKNSRTKIKINCPIHGLFEQTPHVHLSGRGCPLCSESKGERNISKILESFNIKYYKQKIFDECKDKNYLPFDFYLPDHNCCVEYDGLQHFEPIHWFGGENNFNIVKKHDQIRNEYCKNNNIKLLRIKYNENIEKKLKEIL